jgi:acetoin utilization deacetylase AcuC-like enzyme
VSRQGFAEAGRRLAAAGLPTVFVQEGGYDLDTLGDLVLAVLDGFEEAREH